MAGTGDYGKRIIRAGIEIGAIKIYPENPIKWASGYYMPIYNDNRLFLGYPEYRRMITMGFSELVSKYWNDFNDDDFIAGTSTAGISPGTSLADIMSKPFLYVREKPKGHGMGNQIEGLRSGETLNNRRGILIEDLISTGGSSVKAVEALRSAKGNVNHCFSIFSYGLPEARKLFESLDPPCISDSLADYDIFIEEADKMGYISKDDRRVLDEWHESPYTWGDKHGFPKK